MADRSRNQSFLRSARNAGTEPERLFPMAEKRILPQSKRLEVCQISYGSVELNAQFHSYNPMGSLIPSQLQQSEEAGRK